MKGKESREGEAEGINGNPMTSRIAGRQERGKVDCGSSVGSPSVVTGRLWLSETSASQIPNIEFNRI